MNKLLLLIMLLSSLKAISQANFMALWNYNSITGSPVNPIADQGVGTSSVVGSFVVAAAATGMDPLINNGCGSQNGTNPGAWAFTATPGLTNESSGVQYNVSTLGFQNVLLTWDMRFSNTAANTVRLQYTIDGSTWTNFTMTSTNTIFCNGVLDNGRFQNNGVGDQYRRISVSFTGITGVANNANFAVRILAAHYQSTGEFRQTSTPTNIATAGTWRFDNVSFQGRTDVSIPSASNFFAVNENAGVVNIPIQVTNANAAEINLNLGFSVYSNATENNDFSWTNTMTIPANTNGTFNLPLTIVDDILAEKAERIVVKILSSSNANISTTNNYSIIFIKDNDYVAPVATNELNLQLLSSYSNGAAGTNSAEIVAFDPSTDRLYIANSIAGKLDIVNFSNPSTPVLINSISMAPYGGINSIVARNGIVAAAIENSNPQLNGSVVFFDANGIFQKQVTVGAMPDMICFNNDFTKVLTANEGEPNSTYSLDPEGSVSIIDISSGIPTLSQANVITLPLTAYNGQETALRAQGIRIFSSSASVAQDLEPEYIAISSDNSKAYVTLQENNALLTINLTNNTIQSLTPLGYSNYGAGSNNALDASDQSGMVLITGDLPIKGAYMPDAIAFQQINNQGYLFTANEGDSREFGTVIDANRISSSTFANLDPVAFPDANILKNNKFLGRLSALKYSGDSDGDGDYDELHVMSGRSFSIWNATTGSLVFDSKDLIEQIVANHPTFGPMFNASNTVGAPALKNRSDDKGPEVEGITVKQWNGHTYVFAALERIGGVMIFNVDNPQNPTYVGYANNRSLTNINGPDLGSEGIIVIDAVDSPNGQALVLLANEVSSTLSVYQLNTCAVASGASIVNNSSVLCAGQTTTMSITPQPNCNYQWLLNGLPISGQTSANLTASAAGVYRVFVQNNSLGCADTSLQVAITVNPIPSSVVSISGPTSICPGQTVTLTAPTANAYLWSSGQTTQSITVSTAGNYTLTTTATGCSSTSAPVAIIVKPLPNVTATSSGPLTICQGASVTLTAPAASSYLWSSGQTTQQVVLTSSAAISLTSTLNGCSATSSTYNVVVNPLPLVNAGPDIIVCAGPSVTISITGNATVYNWNSGFQGSSIVIPTQGFTGSNTYTITGINTATNCQVQDQVTVTVLALPTVNAGSNVTTCQGVPVTLNGSSNAANLVWSNGMAPGQSLLLPVGLNTLTLTATAANTCTNSASIQVNVLPAPIVNAGPDQVVCADAIPIQLNATANVNLVYFQGLNSASVSVSNAGSYIAIATNNQSGCSATDTVQVEVLALPIVGLESQYSFCENELPYSFSISSSNLYPFFAWSDGTTLPYFVGSQAGPLSVSVTDSAGCSATFNTTITLAPAPTISLGEDLILCPDQFPYVLNASGSAQDLLWSTGSINPSTEILTSGLYSIEATNQFGCSSSDEILVTLSSCASVVELFNAIEIYPNPTNDFIQIISSEQLRFMRLYSAEGKIVFEQSTSGNEMIISLIDLKTGVYMLEIETNQGLHTERIIKQ
ncbi:MAG: choice-of-anchor I family protein [Flavobacteriales bacterium]